MSIVHPTGVFIYYLYIIFTFSAVRCHTWFPVFSRKSIYPIFTKFGMGVYWVNSLHAIAFGEDSSIANLSNSYLATFVYFFCFRAF